jgi:hypothetical protein
VICAIRRLAAVMAGVMALAVAVPARAQGKSGGKGHQSAAPSESSLPSPSSLGPASGAWPMAWLDDASVLPEGAMSLIVAATHWSGTDLAETDLPVISAALGIGPRVQIGAIVPRVVAGSDGISPPGGVGTSYVSTKIALLTGGSGVKLAVSPMIQILGEGAVQGLAPGESRVQFGLPASIEVSQGIARVFASTGIFSRGAWFAGGGVGVQAAPRVGVAASFTRSWGGADALGVTRDRSDVSGSVSYLMASRVAVYGSIGRTIATSDENGAGTTVSGGVAFLLAPSGTTR